MSGADHDTSHNTRLADRQSEFRHVHFVIENHEHRFARVAVYTNRPQEDLRWALPRVVTARSNTVYAPELDVLVKCRDRTKPETLEEMMKRAGVARWQDLPLAAPRQCQTHGWLCCYAVPGTDWIAGQLHLQDATI